MKNNVEIPFGAKDSELKGWEYTIPEGMEAVIENGKIIVREMESKDETIRKEIIHYILYKADGVSEAQEHNWVTYLEKQKAQKPVHTAREMWKDMRLEVYQQASGNRHESNYSDDTTKMFSLTDIDEIFEKIGDSAVEQKPAERSEEEREYQQYLRLKEKFEGK